MTKSKCRARCFIIFTKKGLLLVLVLLSFLVSLSITCLAASLEDVVINEIAWMGTAASTSDEWIELYNNTDQDIDITGWILVATDGTPSIVLSGTVFAHGYFLLERTEESTLSDISADQIYTGALGNDPSAETLSLKDSLERVIDTANGNGGGWPAGDNSAKYTMERINPLLSDTDANWATNDPNIARNGLDAYLAPINGTPKAHNSATNTDPIADAGADQTILVDEIAHLDGSGSSDADGDPLNYDWKFVTRPSGSNASLSATTIVDPRFGADLPGEYTVELGVNDNYQGSASDQVIVTAQAEPVGAFTCDPQLPTVWETVLFTDLSTDIDGTIASWFWRFGDGGVSVDRSPTHRYWDPGTYAVVLEVTDDDGLTDSMTRDITIALGPGDLDDDGVITVLDARLCLQIALGVIPGTPAQREQADIDHDGDVDETDAQVLAQYVIGI